MKIKVKYKQNGFLYLMKEEKMKEMKSIKRCLALLLALTMVISGMTIPEKKATAAEDTPVANEATEVNNASVEYVAQIGEQSYATFAEALEVANGAEEDVTLKVLQILY